MKQTTILAMATVSSFACFSASAAIQAFNDDCSAVSTRWDSSKYTLNDTLSRDTTNGRIKIDSDTEIPYYTTAEGTAEGTNVVTKLQFQVAFTAATTRPAWQTTGGEPQLQLYLDSTGHVQAMTSSDVQEDAQVGLATNGILTTVTIEKTGTGFSITVGDGAAFPVAKASPTPFKSVGFMGTGTVDNFVGTYGTTGTTDTTDGTTGGDTGYASIESSTAVTGHFETTVDSKDLKFIKVTTDQGTYKLRYTGSSQAITLPEGAGTVLSVVAYYGDSVSAIPGGYSPTVTQVQETEQVVVEGKEQTVSTVGVSVTAESGVYYSLKNGNNVIAKKLVAPAEQGSTISLTFNPASVASKTDWGKTTITFQATDEDPENVQQ